MLTWTHTHTHAPTHSYAYAHTRQDTFIYRHRQVTCVQPAKYHLQMWFPPLGLP